MGAGNSGHFHGTKGGRKSLKVHSGRQGKHIVGHNNYSHGKSIFSGTVEDAQRLIGEFSGKGTPVGKNKERIDFGKPIGFYVDFETGKKILTSLGIIQGAHIVPSQPERR